MKDSGAKFVGEKNRKWCLRAKHGCRSAARAGAAAAPPPAALQESGRGGSPGRAAGAWGRRGGLQRGTLWPRGALFLAQTSHLHPASYIFSYLLTGPQRLARCLHCTDEQADSEKPGDSSEATQPFPRLGHGSSTLSQTLISICGVFLFWACEPTVGGRGGGGAQFLAPSSLHI